jgi:hypothetical protein
MPCLNASMSPQVHIHSLEDDSYLFFNWKVPRDVLSFNLAVVRYAPFPIVMNLCVEYLSLLDVIFHRCIIL